MRFKIVLVKRSPSVGIIPINYQYPLSAAIYKILAKGDVHYAHFLHEEGYGKGYKFFTFSDLRGKFKVRGDRMELLNDRIEFKIHFHLPEASRNFIEGLFKSEEIIVSDRRSKAAFTVQSVLSLPSPFEKGITDDEIIEMRVKPISPVVIGEKQSNGNYKFLGPEDSRFMESLIYSWREKIKATYPVEEAEKALLLAKIEKYENPFRSRLVHIKDGRKEATKIKGFYNFKIILTAEKRFLALIMNAGLGLYSAQGMGCLEVAKWLGEKKNKLI